MINVKEAIALIQITGGAKIVSASYLNKEIGTRRHYHFKNVTVPDLKAGDKVVVQTMDTVEVVEIINPDVRPAECGCGLDKLKHVVAKIDYSSLEKVLEAEREAERDLAMSEVYDRLDRFRAQIGGRFDNVQKLLLGVAPADLAEEEELVRRAAANLGVGE